MTEKRGRRQHADGGNRRRLRMIGGGGGSRFGGRGGRSPWQKRMIAVIGDQPEVDGRSRIAPLQTGSIEKIQPQIAPRHRLVRRRRRITLQRTTGRLLSEG